MGLSYAQQRWYAPEVGRFLSEDPVFGDPMNPSSLMAFGYANGNPTGFTDPDGRFACWIVPGLCDPVNIARGYLAVRSVLSEENQKRLDEHAGKAIQGYLGVKSLLGTAQQRTEKVIDEGAYVKGGGTTLGNIGAAGDSAAGKFIARAAFGVANMAISSPQMAAADLVSAHEQVGDAWSVATDSSASTMKRVEAGAYVLDLFSQDLLMVAGAAQAVGVRGPVVYTPKPRVLPTELVYRTELLSPQPVVAVDAAAGDISAVSRVRDVAQRSFDFAVENPRSQGLNRMQLGKDAEVQATRWLRKWAERNGVEGVESQVRGAHSVPDVVFEPAKQIFDFKLTPKAVRPVQSRNFQADFPGYDIDYIFGPGPWR